MVAGQLEGYVSTQPGDKAVTYAFVKKRGDRDGEDGHADDRRLVVRIRHDLKDERIPEAAKEPAEVILNEGSQTPPSD